MKPSPARPVTDLHPHGRTDHRLTCHRSLRSLMGSRDDRADNGSSRGPLANQQAKDTSQVPLAAQRHRHGPHRRALSRPGAVYQPRADVAGLAELTCGSDEADNGNGDGHGDTPDHTTISAITTHGHRLPRSSYDLGSDHGLRLGLGSLLCHGADDGDEGQQKLGFPKIPINPHSPDNALSFGAACANS
jgi:hypothetical protein